MRIFDRRGFFFLLIVAIGMASILFFNGVRSGSSRVDALELPVEIPQVMQGATPQSTVTPVATVAGLQPINVNIASSSDSGGPSLIAVITAIGTIAGAIVTPILVVVVGNRIQRGTKELEEERARRRELEEKLRDDRIGVYFQILEPFIISQMKEGSLQGDKRFKGKTINEAVEGLMHSVEWRIAVYKFNLVGSDSVVRAFNALMQYFYLNPGNIRAEETMKFLGGFLLELRRGMGNEDTEMDALSMLEAFITDIYKLRQ